MAETGCEKISRTGQCYQGHESWCPHSMNPTYNYCGKWGVAFRANLHGIPCPGQQTPERESVPPAVLVMIDPGGQVDWRSQ